MIVLQEAAEPGLTLDRVDGDGLGRGGPGLSTNQLVSDSLMRAMLEIVGHILTHDVVEVFSAKHDKVIKSLVFEALNPTFDEGIQVRGSPTDGFHANALLGETGIKIS